MGFGLCESVERASFGHSTYRKVEVEATDFCSSRQEEFCFLLDCSGGE